MPNMSYCRFQNTLPDVRDCLEALGNRDINSKEEKRSAGFLLKDMLEFCCREGIIEDYEDDVIDRMIEQCE